MLNLLLLGAEGYINQIDRIRQGFNLLQEPDIEVVDKNDFIDFIYCNDPGVYDEAIEIKQKNKNAKLIFNVLDIPPHLLDAQKYNLSRYTYVNHPYPRDFDIQKLVKKLEYANAITCICKDVQQQLLEWCNLPSEVIYNPIKDVSFLNLKRDIPFLYVGRACDPNKRFNIVYTTLRMLKCKNEDLVVVGSENPGFGQYLGVVSDEKLNNLYNRSRFLFFPSAFKSIGLPALEAVVTKTLPIVCDDDPAGKEFFNGIEVSKNPIQIANTITNKDWLDKTAIFVENNSYKFYDYFNKVSIAKNIYEICKKLEY